MNDQKVKVLLADNHAMVRTAFRLLLEKEGVEVVGEAENGRKAIELVDELHPNIVILEIALPLLNGIEAARHIKARHSAKVLMCSAYSNNEYVWKLTAIRVEGYVLKQEPAADLLRAIREIAGGKVFFSPTIAARMLEQYTSASLNGTPSSPTIVGSHIHLTPREAEVLTLIANGLPNKGIANELGISIKTVQKHRQAVMNKLHIHNIASLTRYALEYGLLVPNAPPPEDV